MLFNILISIVLPFAFIWIGLSFLMRRMSKSGGMMGIGKSNAKMYVEKETGVTFRDVAGEDEAKESLQEVVDFLHNPGKYTGIGAKLPKGALLVGPPGTGKTLLAKAVAGEAKVPFFSLSGSAFVEMYVGVGASRVRDLFKEAQAMAPCIIFIDEIDAIGKSRDNAMGSNDEREQTLNQLLAEMDGFDTDKGLLILAATNRPEILDPALLRPGRFDRRIIVDKPDLKGRVDILKVHAKDVKMDETVDLEAIALATSGAVGSDLANMINEAAINAVKHGRKVVSQEDLFEAVEVVLVGKEKKDRIMNAEERRIVSYHEVGHALVSALQKDAEPVQKITIVPRTMGALGYVKFETFPIWNIPLKHPVNLAYEAATADLNDVNMIDPFHLEAYGITTVNYNRDVEIFPVLSAIFEKIYGENPYKSPTDMGVNMAGNCICDDEACRDASNQEIIRRYYQALNGLAEGTSTEEEVFKIELLMKQAHITVNDRTVVDAALKRAEETGAPAAALELPDGSIITGKTSNLLGASAALLLNALKKLAGIEDEVHIISPSAIEPIQKLKTSYLGSKNPRLHTDEVLIALSISAATNETAQLALDQIPKLRGCQVHTSVMLSEVDVKQFKKLSIQLTSEAKYENKKLYH